MPLLGNVVVIPTVMDEVVVVVLGSSPGHSTDNPGGVGSYWDHWCHRGTVVKDSTRQNLQASLLRKDMLIHVQVNVN
jgi:hypothetical protein